MILGKDPKVTSHNLTSSTWYSEMNSNNASSSIIRPPHMSSLDVKRSQIEEY